MVIACTSLAFGVLDTHVRNIKKAKTHRVITRLVDSETVSTHFVTFDTTRRVVHSKSSWAKMYSIERCCVVLSKVEFGLCDVPKHIADRYIVLMC